MIAKSRKINRYGRENLLSLFKRKPNKYYFDDFMNQNRLHMDLQIEGVSNEAGLPYTMESFLAQIMFL